MNRHFRPAPRGLWGLSVLSGLSVLCGGAGATDPPKPDWKLGARAQIERATAARTALTRVPGGRIKDGELQRDHGHLVWSFDIVQPTTANVTEVQVNAINGNVVSIAVETPADQARGAAADHAKAQHLKSRRGAAVPSATSRSLGK